MNYLLKKKESISHYFTFFNKWYGLFSFSFFLYILLIFFATILESISIISLIPLIQSLDQINTNNIELPEYNKVLINIKNSFDLGAFELILLFFSLQIFKIFITHFSEILLFKKTFSINQKIQSSIIKELTNISWVDFLKTSTGQVNNLISQDSPKASNVFKLLCMGINYSLFIIIYSFGLFFISFKASVVVIIFSILTFLTLRIFAKLTFSSGKKITKSSKEYLNLVTDIFLQMKPLKSSNLTMFIEKKIFTEMLNFRKAQIFQRFMAVGISFFQNLILIILFTIIIVFFIGGNETNIAESVVFIFVAYRLSSQLMSFQQNLNQIIAFLPSTNQLINFFSFLYKKNETFNFGSSKVNFKRILFEDVECKIEKKKIFENLNIEINKNSFVAITGNSGIGKSSLVDMIIGLIPPSKGNILINKTNLNELEINHWRSKISYVPQEHFLLKDNILNNIILDQKFIKKKYNQIIELLELSDLDPNVILSEKGASISVGQKQRVSIARALYADRELLILDEPTSNLNPLLEKKILNYLQKKSLKTIIMISHSKSAIKYASVVYNVTKNGITKI